MSQRSPIDCLRRARMAALAVATLWPVTAVHSALRPDRPSLGAALIPAPSAPVLVFRPVPSQQQPPDAQTTDQYSLSRETVRRVMYVHQNQIKHCYQQALMRKPLLAGRVVVSFVIEPSGHVQRVDLRDAELPPILLPGPAHAPPVVAKPQPLSSAPGLLPCIREAIASWEFPSTPFYSGTLEVSYPFVLRPKLPDPPAGVQVSDDELAELGIFKDPEPPGVELLL